MSLVVLRSKALNTHARRLAQTAVPASVSHVLSFDWPTCPYGHHRGRVNGETEKYDSSVVIKR